MTGIDPRARKAELSDVELKTLPLLLPALPCAFLCIPEVPLYGTLAVSGNVRRTSRPMGVGCTSPMAPCLALFIFLASLILYLQTLVRSSLLYVSFYHFTASCRPSIFSISSPDPSSRSLPALTSLLSLSLSQPVPNRRRG